jgi:hypothetical protein
MASTSTLSIMQKQQRLGYNWKVRLVTVGYTRLTNHVNEKDEI